MSRLKEALVVRATNRAKLMSLNENNHANTLEVDRQMVISAESDRTVDVVFHLIKNHDLKTPVHEVVFETVCSPEAASIAIDKLASEGLKAVWDLKNTAVYRQAVIKARVPKEDRPNFLDLVQRHQRFEVSFIRDEPAVWVAIEGTEPGHPMFFRYVSDDALIEHLETGTVSPATWCVQPSGREFHHAYWEGESITVPSPPPLGGNQRKTTLYAADFSERLESAMIKKLVPKKRGLPNSFR